MGFVYKDEVVIELLSHRQGLTIILQPLVTGPVTWGRGLQVLSQGGAWGSQGGVELGTGGSQPGWGLGQRPLTIQ